MIALIIKHYLIKELDPIRVLPWQLFLSNSCCHGNHLRTFVEIKIFNFNTIISPGNIPVIQYVYLKWGLEIVYPLKTKIYLI